MWLRFSWINNFRLRYPWIFLGLITFSWSGLLYINQPVRYRWILLLPCAVLLYLYEWMKAAPVAEATGAGTAEVAGTGDDASAEAAGTDAPAGIKSKDLVWQRFLIGVPAFVFAVITPFPYRIGAVCVVLSVLLGTIVPWEQGMNRKAAAGKRRQGVGRHEAGRRRAEWRRKLLLGLEHGLMYAGVLHLIQSALVPVYFAVFSRVHKETLITSAIAALLKLFGVSATMNGNLLSVDTFTRVFNLSGNWESIGIFTVLLFLVGGVALLVLYRADWKTLSAFVGTVVVYAFLRYLFVVMAFISYAVTSLFWSRAVTVATFIPLPLILHLLLRGRLSKLAEAAGAVTSETALYASDTSSTSHPPRDTHTARAQRGSNAPLTVHTPRALRASRTTQLFPFLLAFLLAFTAVAFFGYRDYGPDKAGRVLVDEYHSDWEWTTIEYDENWYGQKSGYNYYCLYNLIDSYYLAERNMEVITDEVLSRCDVFVLKTPTLPLSADEIDSIVRFVEVGGGLYLIGDHTNVFGTSTNLNAVAKHFGIRFNMDCTYELERGNLSEFDKPRTLPHPTIMKMPRLLFASTCTLDADWRVEETMIGYGLKSQPADYSQKNFFPAESENANQEFGLFLHAVSAQRGKGKVIAYTDSTIFSNFWMFMPAKPELLLGNIQWLNKENTLSFVQPRVLFLAMFVLLAVILAAWRFVTKKAVFRTVLSAVLLAIPCAVLMFAALDGQAMKAMEPRKPMVDICFDNEYSDFKIAKDIDGFLSDYQHQLQTFYVWMQRLDYVPSLHGKLYDAMDKGEVTVIAKPKRPFKNPEEMLKRVENGAKLLILDHTESGAHSNGLLALAGLEIAPVPDTAAQEPNVDPNAGGGGRGDGSADVNYDANAGTNTGANTGDSDGQNTNSRDYGSALDVGPVEDAASDFERALGGRAIPGERDATPARETTAAEETITPGKRLGIYDEILDIPITDKASVVSGGETRMTDQFGNPILTVRKIGKGLIAVCSDPDLFYSFEMGDVSSNLTPKTEIISRVQFKMMRELVESQPN